MASKDMENDSLPQAEPRAAGPGGPHKPKPDVARRPRWQRLLGIRRRQGRFLRWTLTKWGFLLLVLVGGAATMAGFMEYTMQPEFCESCHIMEPYYQAWHQSTHKGVSCLKCHFEPGLEGTLKGKWQASSQAIKYLTDTYGSKPHAEIHDESCLREECHAKRLLEGKVEWKVPSSRGQAGETVTIRFNHTPHLQKDRLGMTLRCVSCHSQIVQGQHIVVTLDTCFLCHFKGLKHGRDDQTIGHCTGCHDAPKDKIRLATGLFDHGQYLKRGVGCESCHSDSIKGDGAVPKQVCWVCHNKPDQTRRYAEKEFLHTAHITAHKVECSSCHIQIEHNLTAGGGFNAHSAAQKAEMLNSPCGQCHEQTHLGPDALYRGIGGRGVPDMPSPMSRTQVDCIGCHKAKDRPGEIAQVVGQTFRTAQSSCDYCHGDKYLGRLDEWKKTIATHIAAAEAAHAKASAAVSTAKMGDMDILKARRLLDDAAHNIRLVKLGYGVHNVNYATALLNYAQDCCKKAEGAAAGGSQ